MYIIFSDIKGTRASRRRRKRKDILNKAAENELAEIGLEQQMLKEQCLKTTGQKSSKDEKGQTPGILKINPKTQASGKKSKQNVSLDLGAVIDALEVLLDKIHMREERGLGPQALTPCSLLLANNISLSMYGVMAFTLGSTQYVASLSAHCHQ